MSESNKTVETSYNEVIKPSFYSISQASEKINISTTKINHWIFKLNKANSDFFKDSSRLTEDDLDKIKLAQTLLEDGRNFEEIVDYFTNESNALIDKKDYSVRTDLTTLDAQVLSKAITIEVEKNINNLIDSIENQFTKDILNEFKTQASNIAKASLTAIEQTRNQMIDEIVELKIQNEFFKSEIERSYSKQTEELRRKLEEKEKALRLMEEEKNKSWFSKIFK